jgi:hypothetical protein
LKWVSTQEPATELHREGRHRTRPSKNLRIWKSWFKDGITFLTWKERLSGTTDFLENKGMQRSFQLQRKHPVRLVKSKGRNYNFEQERNFAEHLANQALKTLGLNELLSGRVHVPTWDKPKPQLATATISKYHPEQYRWQIR